MKKLSPAWFLFFFAPLTVEYASGSTSTWNPIVLGANLLLYGPGTLMIRELRVRWGKGWLAVFILSIAYVVAEEGLMLNTLFDPTQNTAGRLLGVNWVWTTGMVVVHSLVSIFVPILLAEAVYHEKANEPWLKPRSFGLLLVAFLANIFGLGRLIAPLHRPPIIYYLSEEAFIGGCLWLAYKIPSPQSGLVQTTAVRSVRWLYFGSLAGMLVTMVVGFAAPALSISPAAKIALMMGAYLGYLGWLKRNRAFDLALEPPLKFAIASGMISFWLLVSPAVSFGKRSVEPALAGALVAGVLFSAQRRLRQESPAIDFGKLGTS